MFERCGGTVSSSSAIAGTGAGAGAACGTLRLFARGDTSEVEPRSIPTPAVICRLWQGMPMYSTLDLVQELPTDTFLGHLEATDLMHRSTTDEPLWKAMSTNKKQLNILSARAMENGVTSVLTGEGVSVNLYSGRKTLTSDEFVRRATAEQPSAVVSMADDVPFTASKKRVTKAKDRTEKWFRELKSCGNIDWKSTFLFGSVVGAAEVSLICETAKACIEAGAHGVIHRKHLLR
jgi:hypothetical protein